MPIKRIKLFCYGPITIGHESPWEDIWFTLFVGKRERKTFAPCLISRTSLNNDIKSQELLINNQTEWCDEKFKILCEIQNKLRNGCDFLDDYSSLDDCFNIYCNTDFITKDIAEKVIWMWLCKHEIVAYGIKPKFNWKRN